MCETETYRQRERETDMKRGKERRRGRERERNREGKRERWRGRTGEGLPVMYRKWAGGRETEGGKPKPPRCLSRGDSCHHYISERTCKYVENKLEQR